MAFGSSSSRVTYFDLNLTSHDSTNMEVGNRAQSVHPVPKEEDEAVKSPLLAAKDDEVKGFVLNMTP